ncbi:TetR/AcrR family transcriptional regulator [Micromonospora sp. PPF5-17]|uniref:TetR/AcrR family transcriptional regulator n=2 Tax=Micromonosporaceae TaxID=28056 RepID=A0ABX9WBV0_9ACTN|nr:TetR/AcrR family transcriptional regulator [Micromonospora sp. PPF5-17B]NES38473.1 TetR/AcrR family transcriptional regulator [Micromonospora solifontis]NES55798.1 TetR/AcrR family transcriptional regulator [Micromonospora sp. PPF5-6]RNL95776.1 TetR/AcrR family transcriptional regulator [Micromonospora solifontis]
MCGMPRVSEEHRAARRQQILDAARRCFLRDGFHNTSMQDVIAEAGLSVGAVYRYFPSKNDLITAIAQAVIGGADGVFAELAAVEPPLPLAEALDRALTYVDAQTGPDGMLPLAIQVWSEAQRDRALAEFVAATYARFRGHFVAIARRARDGGELSPDADPDAVGTALFGLVPGYFMQRILTGSPDRSTYLAGVRALLAGRHDRARARQ